MPRRRYYRRPRINNDKYSVERTLLQTPTTDQWTQVPGTGQTQTSQQTFAPIVPAIQEQGMRKVKHLEITASNPTAGAGPIYYVVAFVPQGYEPQQIIVPSPGNSSGCYQANQFVMSSGWLDFDGGPLRIRTPLSRNLNSGDSVYLILASLSSSTTIYYVFDIKYAITLQ